MTYREALKLHVESRVSPKKTASLLKVKSIRPWPDAKHLVIACDDGHEYAHKNLNPGFLTYSMNGHTIDGHKLPTPITKSEIDKLFCTDAWKQYKADV